jgi:transposase-like protein
MRQAIGRQLRAVRNATHRPGAEAEIARIVERYVQSAPKRAAWLEHAIPEGLAVVSLPKAHWRRMRTANPRRPAGAEAAHPQDPRLP